MQGGCIELQKNVYITKSIHRSLLGKKWTTEDWDDTIHFSVDLNIQPSVLLYNIKECSLAH